MSKHTLILDASQIKLYDSFCHLAWAYTYRENLRLSTLGTEAPDKGNLAHDLLETYYNLRALNPNDDAWKSALMTIDIFKAKKAWEQYNFPPEMGEFLCKRFHAYVGYWYGRDFKPLRFKERTATEMGFSKVIYEDPNVLFILEGKIDLINIVEDKEGILCITDHKTQDRESHYYNYRPQMLSYALAARELGIKYGCINYFGMQKEYKDKVTFRRDTMSIPSWMLDRWHNYILKKVYWPIYRNEIAEKTNIETHGLAARTTEELWDQRLSSCSGAFETHPCQFARICETNNLEMIQNIKNFHYHRVAPWSPWKDKKKEQI